MYVARNIPIYALALSIALQGPATALRPTIETRVEQQLQSAIGLEEWKTVLAQSAEQWRKLGWLQSDKHFRNAFTTAENRANDLYVANRNGNQSEDPEKKYFDRRMRFLERFALLTAELGKPTHTSNIIVIRKSTGRPNYKKILLRIQAERSLALWVEVVIIRTVTGPKIKFILFERDKGSRPMVELGEARIGSDNVRKEGVPFIHVDFADRINSNRMRTNWASHIGMTRAWTDGGQPEAMKEALLGRLDLIDEHIEKLPVAESNLLPTGRKLTKKAFAKRFSSQGNLIPDGTTHVHLYPPQASLINVYTRSNRPRYVEPLADQARTNTNMPFHIQTHPVPRTVREFDFPSIGLGGSTVLQMHRENLPILAKVPEFFSILITRALFGEEDLRLTASWIFETPEGFVLAVGTKPGQEENTPQSAVGLEDSDKPLANTMRTLETRLLRIREAGTNRAWTTEEALQILETAYKTRAFNAKWLNPSTMKERKDEPVGRIIIRLYRAVANNKPPFQDVTWKDLLTQAEIPHKKVYERNRKSPTATAAGTRRTVHTQPVFANGTLVGLGEAVHEGANIPARIWTNTAVTGSQRIALGGLGTRDVHGSAFFTFSRENFPTGHAYAGGQHVIALMNPNGPYGRWPGYTFRQTDFAPIYPHNELPWVYPDFVMENGLIRGDSSFWRAQDRMAMGSWPTEIRSKNEVLIARVKVAEHPEADHYYFQHRDAPWTIKFDRSRIDPPSHINVITNPKGKTKTAPLRAFDFAGNQVFPEWAPAKRTIPDAVGFAAELLRRLGQHDGIAVDDGQLSLTHAQFEHLAGSVHAASLFSSNGPHSFAASMNVAFGIALDPLKPWPIDPAKSRYIPAWEAATVVRDDWGVQNIRIVQEPDANTPDVVFLRTPEEAARALQQAFERDVPIDIRDVERILVRYHDEYFGGIALIPFDRLLAAVKKRLSISALTNPARILYIAVFPVIEIASQREPTPATKFLHDQATKHEQLVDVPITLAELTGEPASISSARPQKRRPIQRENIGMEESAAPIRYNEAVVAERLLSRLAGSELLIHRFLDPATGILHLNFRQAAALLESAPTYSGLRNKPSNGRASLAQRINRELRASFKQASPTTNGRFGLAHQLAQQHGVESVVIQSSVEDVTVGWSKRKVVNTIRKAKAEGLALNMQAVESQEQRTTSTGRKLYRAAASVSSGRVDNVADWWSALEAAGEDPATIYKNRIRRPGAKATTIKAYANPRFDASGHLVDPGTLAKEGKSIMFDRLFQTDDFNEAELFAFVDVRTFLTNTGQVSFSYRNHHYTTSIDPTTFDPQNPTPIVVVIDPQDPFLVPQLALTVATNEVVYPTANQVKVYLDPKTDGPAFEDEPFLFRAVNTLKPGLWQNSDVAAASVVVLDGVHTYNNAGTAFFLDPFNSSRQLLTTLPADRNLKLRVRIAGRKKKVTIAYADGQKAWPRPKGFHMKQQQRKEAAKQLTQDLKQARVTAARLSNAETDDRAAAFKLLVENGRVSFDMTRDFLDHYHDEVFDEVGLLAFQSMMEIELQRFPANKRGPKQALAMFNNIFPLLERAANMTATRAHIFLTNAAQSRKSRISTQRILEDDKAELPPRPPKPLSKATMAPIGMEEETRRLAKERLSALNLQTANGLFKPDESTMMFARMVVTHPEWFGDRALELGTGNAGIGLLLAQEGIQTVATELLDLDDAKRNVAQQPDEISQRITLIQSNLYENLGRQAKPYTGGFSSVVFVNPILKPGSPYARTATSTSASYATGTVAPAGLLENAILELPSVLRGPGASGYFMLAEDGWRNYFYWNESDVQAFLPSGWKLEPTEFTFFDDHHNVETAFRIYRITPSDDAYLQRAPHRPWESTAWPGQTPRPTRFPSVLSGLEDFSAQDFGQKFPIQAKRIPEGATHVLTLTGQNNITMYRPETLATGLEQHLQDTPPPKHVRVQAKPIPTSPTALDGAFVFLWDPLLGDIPTIAAAGPLFTQWLGDPFPNAMQLIAAALVGNTNAASVQVLQSFVFEQDGQDVLVLAIYL